MPKDHGDSAQDNMAYPYGVELFGPILRSSHDLLLNGQRVPFLEMYAENNRPEDDMWCITVDRRLGIEAARGDEVRKWVWFMANAMAVSAGYVRFGTDERINPFQKASYIDPSMNEMGHLCEPRDREEVLLSDYYQPEDVWSIPYLKIYEIPDDPEGCRILFLDGRWAMKATKAEYEKWITHFAAAMAIAAGYVHFMYDKRVNRFNPPTVVGLSTAEYQSLQDEGEEEKREGIGD